MSFGFFSVSDGWIALISIQITNENWIIEEKILIF